MLMQFVTHRIHENIKIITMNKILYLKLFYIISLIMFILVGSTRLVFADMLRLKPIETVKLQELAPPWETNAQPVKPIPAKAVEKKPVRVVPRPKIKPKIVKPEPVARRIIKPVKREVVTSTSRSVTPVPVVQRRQVQRPVAAKTPAKRPVAQIQQSRQTSPVVTSPVNSIQRIQAAANRGDRDAQYQLGVAHQYGNGVKKSRQLANKWLQRAANAGHSQAQYALAVMYLEYGANIQSVKKALYLYRKSADQGNAEAQYSLGMMFMNGTYVIKDQAEAKKWLGMAANQGHMAAKLALMN
jgi:hypothetical protein